MDVTGREVPPESFTIKPDSIITVVHVQQIAAQDKKKRKEKLNTETERHLQLIYRNSYS